MSAKNVVIIGGGPSGKSAAELLAKDKNLNVTVIQANEFVEWAVAMTYVLTNPDLHHKALSKNPEKYEVPGVTYKYAVVSGVDASKKEVRLSDDTNLTYDYLVVASGFSLPLFYPRPGQSLGDREGEIKKVGKALADASTVVVNGGGVVGLELVGDIRVAYPSKQVVLVVRRELLEGLDPEKRERIMKVLEERKIEVIKGTVEGPSDWSSDPGQLTINGQRRSYDVYIPAYSRGPNTGFLEAALLDASKKVKLNAKLQSEKYSEVFAVGVGTTPDKFVAILKLEAQWKCVAGNIKAMAASKPLKDYKETAPNMTTPMNIPIGRGPNGWAMFQWDLAPAPMNLCLCNGLGGFPCCPLPCCWCCGCGLCPCGYCCGKAEGSGPAQLSAWAVFKTGEMRFKGFGEEQKAPKQESMQGSAVRVFPEATRFGSQ